MLTGVFSQLSSAVELMVVYPQVRQPFAEVFDEIVRGAEAGYSGGVKRAAFSENQSPVDFVHVVDIHTPVLLLGNRISRLVSEADIEHRLIVGAVSNEVANVHGITLIPSPSAIAQKLPVLVPKVKNVHIVAKPGEHVISLEKTTRAFTLLGIQFVVHRADDVRAAAAVYRDLVHQLDGDDAVWIPPDGAFLNNALLAILLQGSWDRHFVVFSSNPVHVKRGALFSVYPNNYKMGFSLGRLAQDVANGRVSTAKMKPLEDIFIALNERTSNHLGINLTDDMRKEIDLVLPAR